MADRLGAALEGAGIVIERADVVMGNIKAWESIPVKALIGRLVQNGWRVRFIADRTGPPTTAYVIHRGNISLEP